MDVLRPARGAYVRWLRRRIADGPIPCHVGLIMDGNRRWARSMGLADTSLGHRYGARRAEDLLRWCERVGIAHVTVYLCSTENLLRRGRGEVDALMDVIETGLARSLEAGTWRVHTAGMLDALPDSTVRALKDAVEQTSTLSTGQDVTLAIGYGGQQEILDAVRDLLYERAALGETPADVAERLTIDDIARH
ncbi:MAG: undecaprenyl diphosphate synthase family protein, partial [Actinomycetia bacterium]|nr:undecaprenyl diphosphate synthase family protein [Actinomycetes bacterium]